MAEKARSRSNAIFWVGVLYLFLGLLLLAIPTSMLSGVASASNHQTAGVFNILWFKNRYQLHPETYLALLAVVGGLLGSFYYGANSYIHYVGTRTFDASYSWWYVLRPFVGGALALITYLVVRGGFLTVQGGPEDINAFVVVGAAAIVGLFSKEASAKLHEVAITLFRPKDADQELFTIGLPNTEVTLTKGRDNDPVSVDISRVPGFYGDLKLSLEGAPRGVTGTFDPSALYDDKRKSKLTLEATSEATPGTATLNVVAHFLAKASESRALLSLTVKESNSTT